MTAQDLSTLTEQSKELIEKFLQENNKSIHYLGKEAGVQSTQLWLFLSGKRGLTANSLEKIGKVIIREQK